MASKLMSLSLREAVKKAPLGASQIHHLPKIGKREVVGYGWNGTATYNDRVDYPMPAIRYREDTKQIASLREKEKGDWKKLTLEEKKALYRASFCKTFAEIKAPTGEWKMALGGALIACSLGVLFTCWMNSYVYDDYPVTLDEDRQKAQLKRMLDLEINPISGLSSKWDYENKKWK